MGIILMDSQVVGMDLQTTVLQCVAGQQLPAAKLFVLMFRRHFEIRATTIHCTHAPLD